MLVGLLFLGSTPDLLAGQAAVQLAPSTVVEALLTQALYIGKRLTLAVEALGVRPNPTKLDKAIQMLPLVTVAIPVISMITYGISQYWQKNETSIIKPEFSFEELAGVDAPKQRVSEALIQYLYTSSNNSTIFGTEPVNQNAGLGLPKHSPLRLIFNGPSGTGKTLLAEVVAHSFNHPIIKVPFSTFKDKYQGVGCKNLIKQFDSLAKDGGIIYVDECDGIMTDRSKLDADQTATKDIVNTLLACLSNEKYNKVGFIGTTNLGLGTDKAMQQRFTIINFTLPNENDRRKVLQSMIRKKNIQFNYYGDENSYAEKTTHLIDQIAKQTEGFSHRELAKILEIAGKKTLFQRLRLSIGHKGVTEQNIFAAIEEISQIKREVANKKQPEKKEAGLKGQPKHAQSKPAFYTNLFEPVVDVQAHTQAETDTPVEFFQPEPNSDVEYTYSKENTGAESTGGGGGGRKE
jgi:SpoVK/Ycf46/Vps4 family AAA+-type ATPase